KLGIKCMVVNPADIPSTHKEKDKKSDKIDSHKLARELENNNLRPIFVPSEEAQHLRSLVRLYLTYTQNITRSKNQIKSFLDYNGINLPKHTSSWSNNFITYLYSITIDNNGPGDKTLYSLLDTLCFLRKEQNNILKQVRVFIKNSSFKQTFDLLRTVPGIGFKIGIIVLSEIIDMNRFKNFDQLKSYVGLAPSVYSSGNTYYEYGLTYRKNSRLKYALIEASWVAIRKDPVLLETYNKLITRMKKQQAIIRIAKKLLSRIRYVWLNQKPYVIGVVE
ncbi:IS110 family RNA-guided transposase, partial [Desulfothermus okinawensis]